MSGERRRATPRTRVDPVLRRQLESAAAGADDCVEAVLRLRQPALRSSRAVELPVRELAERLFERVAHELGVGSSAYDWNVFPNLGYSVLKAPTAFVECVLRQPEVASASANRRPEDSDEPAQGRVRRRRSSST